MADQENQEGPPPQGTMLPGTPARSTQEAPDAVWSRRDKLLVSARVMETLQAKLQPLAQARASPGPCEPLRETAASERGSIDPKDVQEGMSVGIPVISWQLDNQLDEMMASRNGSPNPKIEVRERLVQELKKIGLWTGTSETQPIHTRGAMFQTRTAPDIRVHVQIAARSDQESWPLVSEIHCTSVRCGLAQDTASKAVSLLEARRYWRQRFLSEALQTNPGQPEPDGERAVQSMQWPEATQEFFVSILMEAVFNALKDVKLPGAQPMPSLQTESLQDFCFPPLYAEDTYADMGCQLSPPQFLNVAAPLWMAVTRSLADTKRELQRLGGQAHLQVALNTPVVYKSSSKRGKLLCGNVLMFVLDSLSQRQSGGSPGEQRDVIRSLLEHRADAESCYGMFPIGTKDSLGEFPVLSLAKDQVVTQLLLDHGAQPDQTSLVNFFPSGSCLWTATWRSSPVFTLLLRHSKGVDNHGWYPDTSPLIPGQEPDGCRVLALAAMTSAEEHMKLLLEKDASLGQDMAHVLAYCPSGNARILARSLFQSAKNARQIVDGSALRRMSGMRLELFFKEVLNHGPCQKALREALAAECRDPKRKHPKFLLNRTVQEILTKAPLAAGCLLDFQARPPDVADLNRFPLAQSCFFDVHELQNTAYVGGVQWTNRTEDRAEMFADNLAPPVAMSPWLAGKAKTNPYLMLFITALYSVLPEYRRQHACEITVLRHPNILNPTVMQTLEKLPHEQLVTLFMKSYAFRGIAYHLWTVYKGLCYMDVSITVLQLLSLVIWWRSALIEEVVIACWCIFTAGVLLDASGVLLKLSQLRRPSFKRVLQTGLGFWMSYITWAATTSSPFRTPTAVNMALGILGGIYELRLFYPLGLPLGSNLVPIMRAAQTSQFMAMLILLMSIIAATYLAACVEFRELGDELLPVAVRTWQTLIVGESSLYDVDDYEHELPRYLFVSALFFVCNVVLMNIFINVTGASYEEERKLECGTFSAERFGTCMEFTGITLRSRQLVLVLVGLAVLSKAAISLVQWETRILVCELVVLACFLMLYGVQWFLGMRADRLFDGTGKPRYLWICRAVCQEDEDETEKEEKKPVESTSCSSTSVTETVAHRVPTRRPTVPIIPTGPQHDWLHEFVSSMQLDFGKYLELTLQLAEKNSILQSHMLEFLRSSADQHSDSSQCILDLPKYLLQTLQWSETNSLVQGELLHFIARCAKDQKSASEYVEQLILRLNLSPDDATHVRKQVQEAWSGGSTAQTG